MKRDVPQKPPQQEDVHPPHIKQQTRSGQISMGKPVLHIIFLYVRFEVSRHFFLLHQLYSILRYTFE